MNDLEPLRGYPSPQYAAEAAAVKWMLDHNYPKTDLLSCYAYLKQDPFWATKPLTMNSVKANIGAWIAAGRLAAPPAVLRPSPNVNGSAPRRSEPDYTEDARRIADQKTYREANAGKTAGAAPRNEAGT
jgi:hypothetical protein